jgi:hypothetical protein
MASQRSSGTSDEEFMARHHATPLGFVTRSYSWIGFREVGRRREREDWRFGRIASRSNDKLVRSYPPGPPIRPRERRPAGFFLRLALDSSSHRTR